MAERRLVFLHGWAQSRQVWFQQRACFPDGLFLNLPGHGGAPDVDAEAWVDVLAEQLPDEACTLVGWSLGGMLAMALAERFPDKVASMALIATTPRFRVGDGWLYGCDEAVFSAFAEAAASASLKTLNRFFALMLHGDGWSRADYNELARMAVDREQRTSAAGLAEGMKLLAALDLRQSLPQQPALLVHGEQDAIVPVTAGRWLAGQMHSNDLFFPGACGHAPFLTRADEFNTLLKRWWQQS
ncbi:alpha/beta fold hydrolase [Mariprofundus erugo]|uniref:Alpha/beta fold hydrolase n=1 Tax=Mariprofundus erugo TaxID=2528639 RepID=A0A5R9GWE6_9PROT|nr:alpha/beta fold hydrolase [Mariprofundus erugo]TLS68553.1 alpha/beta fold hydrolase [Mariprofundus erugo]